MERRGAEISGDVSGALRQYFDPSTGALPQRIEALLRSDGELDRALRAHLALAFLLRYTGKAAGKLCRTWNEVWTCAEGLSIVLHKITGKFAGIIYQLMTN